MMSREKDESAMDRPEPGSKAFPAMRDLEELFHASAARHAHLCPRQVLGVRFGLAGASALGLETPRQDKRLMAIIETDGCFADGIEAATGCSVGHRTMRVEDYGKVAVTFVDTRTGRAVRIAPRLDVRQRAASYAEGESRAYVAQLHAYQSMPEDELLVVREVGLTVPVEKIVSRPRIRVACDACGEEIINERETLHEGRTLCRACAAGAYYEIAPNEGGSSHTS
jgi:formylmethanofuran dehydrogenase subunit E